MTNLKEFIDEHGLSAEDVIDALDIDPESFADTPESPHDFYDGEPSKDELAEDFDAVDLLIDEKQKLQKERDALKEEVREAKRPVFEDKAEELAEMTDKWGDKEDLLEKFDAEDEDLRWSVDDLTEKIELVEDIMSETTTVTNDSESEETEEPDIERTRNGRFDLRDRTKVQ